MEQEIEIKKKTGTSAKQTVVKLEHRIKNLTEIIKYAEQYQATHPYHIAYKKAKNPDVYFRKYESEIILYNGAKYMLEQSSIHLKTLNTDKLKAAYLELIQKKREQTTIYKNYEKEIKQLTQKLENLNQYLGVENVKQTEQKGKQQSQSLSIE